MMVNNRILIVIKYIVTAMVANIVILFIGWFFGLGVSHAALCSAAVLTFLTVDFIDRS